MIELSRGQKTPLRQMIHNGPVMVTVEHRPADIDIAAFGLAADRKIGDDRYVVLFSNPRSPDGAITLENSASRTRFTIDVDRLPHTIDRVVLTATHDCAPISHAQELRIVIGMNDAVYEARNDLTTETAVMLIEIYRHAEGWRLGVIGQGFNGGLASLVSHFGGDIDTTPSQPSAPPASAPDPVAAAAPPAAPRLNLQKVTLEKKQSISLEKRGQAFGEILLNLNWSRGSTQRRGFFGGSVSKAIDLDLGCLYVLKNGSKGVVQALGRSFGRFDSAPFLQLSGDDRTGDGSSGETIRINGKYFDNIEKLAVFALIYEGVPNWAETNGVVTMTSPNQPPLEVRMTDGRNNRPMCGIALIENEKGRMKVSRIVEYYKGHEDFADSVGIRLRWVAGRKD